jgi:hypothetical protein
MEAIRSSETSVDRWYCSISRLFAVCSLFKDNVCNSDYVASNDWMLRNNGLGRMWKEATVASFKVPYRNLPGETEENNE